MCEWDITFYEENQDQLASNWQEHESVGKMQTELDKPHPLSACFDLFSKGDSLNVNCNYCKESQPSKKKTLVQHLPPVLVLHLKRFKLTS